MIYIDDLEESSISLAMIMSYDVEEVASVHKKITFCLFVESVECFYR
ncbi:MAG: hypothetical protein RSA53_10320 [Odoribacter sp.]